MRQKKQERGRTGDTIFHCNTFASSYLTTKINKDHIVYLPSPKPHFQITVSRTKVIMRRKLYLQKKPFNPVFTWPPLMKIPEFFNLPLETGRLCMLALNSPHSQHRGFPGTERNVEITNLRCGRVRSALLQVRRQRQAGCKERLKYFRK